MKALCLNLHANRVAAGKHKRRKFAIQTKSLKEICSFIGHMESRFALTARSIKRGLHLLYWLIRVLWNYWSSLGKNFLLISGNSFSIWKYCHWSVTCHLERCVRTSVAIRGRKIVIHLLGNRIPSTLVWTYTEGNWLYCDYFIWCVFCRVIVLTWFVICGCVYVWVL